MENIKAIQWGILGCGDVCEVKSGPAFNKVGNSRLVAVMRRDAGKARDFARRHQVPKYYSDADELIRDPDINAIYIATPPLNHEDYAIRCMQAGKPVYIEKPVALNSASCERILQSSKKLRVKASVAHYRRGLPVFKKIRSLITSGVIGKPGLVMATTLEAPGTKIDSPGYWRTNPEISGGGLFFDLAPHQLDIFHWLFGHPTYVHGYSVNQTGRYPAPDLTGISAMFGDVCLHAIWAFNVSSSAEEEKCEIIGDRGKITFSFFRPSDISITTQDGIEKITLDYPENIQQPMIDEVVKFFMDGGPNPCSLDEALVTMRMMDSTNTDSKKGWPVPQ